MADSKLQTAPLGLLGAFQLKTLGDNPTLFGDRLQPVIEAMGFYGLASRSFQLATGNLTNPGDTLTLTVPARQIWRVLCVSGRAVIGALDVNGFVGFVGTRPTSDVNQSLVAIAENQVVQPAAGATTIHCAVSSGFGEPFFLGPGAQLALFLGIAFNAARACSLQAIVEAYEI